jgi:AcrR family transcriptional regulator
LPKKTTEIASEKSDLPKKRIGRRDRRSIETREKIFRVALQLLAERGFSATTIDAIAEGADIGKGTFFNYFENKESILLQFQEMQIRRVKEFVAESMNSDKTLIALIYKLAVTMTAEQQKSPTLFRSLITAIFSNDAIRHKMAEGTCQGREMLADLIGTRQQTGEIRSDLQAKEIARSLQSMVLGTTLVWSLAPESALEDHLSDMVNVFVKGIQPECAKQADDRGGN